MALTQASRQWATRPPDERFSSLQALHDACTYHREHARTANIQWSDLRVKAAGDNLTLNGRTGVPAEFTNWSFGQVCSRIGAPATYLAELPAELAASNLNHGLEKDKDEQRIASLLIHENGGLILRAATSDKYERIWNNDVTARLLRLAEQGTWQPAPAAFDGSRGLYASDHDLFAFLVDSERKIFEKAPGGGLSRGFFTWNSEVGASSFGVMRFFYEYVCGNHMVWGAKDVQEIRIRHVGDAPDKAFGQLQAELRKYAEGSAAEDEAVIQRAMLKEIGQTKDEVLDAIFGLRVPALSRKKIEEAYDAAEKHVDWYGSPRSVWGMANGLTEIARDIAYTDKRVELERASARVMDMAF